MSPTTVNDPYDLVGTVLDGRYRVDRAVARGGFGVVYRALQLALHKDVAIKVLRVPDELREEHAQAVYNLFHLEARTIARLSHPAIVQAIDQGVSAMPNARTAPWMVLEWLTGHTLREYLREQGGRAWSMPAALALLRPVFDALACAHEGGVAHRDVKPSNVMVVPGRRGALTLRLMDFGIAKLMEDGEAAGTGGTRTASAFSPFTERYAAPEQTTGARTGPWTDVHAMGLVLTELLVGRPPYLARTRHGLLAEIMDAGQRPTPRRHGVDVGPWEAVLARALHRLPGERYAHAGDFLAALEHTQPAAATTFAPPSAPPVDEVTRPDPACAPVPREETHVFPPAVSEVPLAHASTVLLPATPTRSTPWLRRLAGVAALAVMVVAAVFVGRALVPAVVARPALPSPPSASIPAPVAPHDAPPSPPAPASILSATTPPVHAPVSAVPSRPTPRAVHRPAPPRSGDPFAVQ